MIKESNTKNDNTVAVVGNGVAALLTALLLAKRHWSCVIYSSPPILSSMEVVVKASRVVALFPTVIEALRSVVSAQSVPLLQGHTLSALSILDGDAAQGPRVDFLAQDFEQPYWAQTLSQTGIVKALLQTIEHQMDKQDSEQSQPIAPRDRIDITQVTSPITAIIPDASPHSALIQTNQGERRHPLVVLADGGRSKSAKLAGIEIKQRGYDAHVLGAVLHHDPVEGGNFHSFERHTQGRCLTLIPVADDRTSFLWLAHSDDISALHAKEAAERDREIMATVKMLSPALSVSAVHDIAMMPLHSNWGCVGYRGRCIALGDAAHVMLPIAAQGLNNTIKDVFAFVNGLPDGRYRLADGTGEAQLCSSLGKRGLKAGKQYGQEIDHALRRYAQRRNPDLLKRQLFVHGLSRSIFQGQRGINSVRALGLRVVNRSPRMKKALVRDLSVTIPSHMVPQ